VCAIDRPIPTSDFPRDYGRTDGLFGAMVGGVQSGLGGSRKEFP